MSPSAEPNPVTSSSFHSRISAFPSKPVAPKIVIRMRQVLLNRCAAARLASHRHFGTFYEYWVAIHFR